MRRILVFLLLITGILTIIAGIGEAATHQTRPFVFHIVVASIFIFLCLVHIVLKRKAVMRYIKGGK
jgi:ABC-type arginine transport system permease subunit